MFWLTLILPWVFEPGTQWPKLFLPTPICLQEIFEFQILSERTYIWATQSTQFPWETTENKLPLLFYIKRQLPSLFSFYLSDHKYQH